MLWGTKGNENEKFVCYVKIENLPTRGVGESVVSSKRIVSILYNARRTPTGSGAIKIFSRSPRSSFKHRLFD